MIAHMRKPTPKVSRCKWTKASSGFVVEGLRVAGKRVRRFFPTRKKAKSFLRVALARQRKEGEAGLLLTGAGRAEAVHAIEALQPHGKTLTDAVRHYLDHLQTLERTCPVGELIVKFLVAKAKDGLSAAYLRDLENRLARFAEDFGKRPVAEITTQEIDEWLRALPVALQTRKNFQTVLGTFFEFAVPAFARENPVTRTAEIKVKHPPAEIFTPAQMRALLADADREFVPVLGLGAFAGLRQSEIERLDWSAIDLPRSRIRLDAAATKTGQRRLVDIPANLAAWLAPVALPSGLVVESAKRMRLHRLAAMKAAKIKAWPLNGLRHSYASYHLALYSNAAKTAEQLGHSTSKTTYQHYREVCTIEDAREWFGLMPPVDFTNIIPMESAAANKR